MTNAVVVSTSEVLAVNTEIVNLLTVNNDNVISVADPEISIIAVAQQGPAGPRGLTGATGTGGAIQYNFAWGDASPQIVIPISVDKTIFRIDCVITQEFDGIGTTVTLGDIADHSRLIGPDQVDLAAQGIYQTNPGVKYLTPTDINIYISLAGGNSTGSGFFLIYTEN